MARVIEPTGPHRCHRRSPAHVYLVKSLSLFKIGLASDLAQRISQLANMSAAPIELLDTSTTCCYQRAAAREKYLHYRYRSSRRHGEWFALSRPQLIQIAATLSRWRSKNGTARGIV